MPVSDKLKVVSENMPRWSLMRALNGGEDYVKGEIGPYSSKEFLPEFSDKDDARYAKYVKRAVYYNFTGWTLTGLVGSIFRKDMSFELPESIEYAEGNIDGQGLDLHGFAKFISSEVLLLGRIGVLVDVSDGIAKCVTYCAESGIAWEISVKDGQMVLSMVRLVETIDVPLDEFTTEEQVQYRVVALDDSGYCYHQIYNESEEKVGEEIYIKRSDGSNLDYIPFIFVGAENNKPDIDKPPLLDIGKINLGHYRNSADFEENMFIHGQGTLVLDTGLVTTDQLKEAYPNGFKVGSRGALAGPGFSGQMLQVNASSALKEAMLDKVSQMVGLGARFIQQRSGNERTDSVRMDKAQKESGLSTAVGNIESALQTCLEWMADIMGGNPEQIELAINRDFYDASLTAQEVSALIMLADSGYMAADDINYLLKKINWLRSERTSEDIASERSDSGGFTQTPFA